MELDQQYEKYNNCDGPMTSTCCGVRLDTDTGLCYDCHDHADSACVDCEELEYPYHPNNETKNQTIC